MKFNEHTNNLLKTLDKLTDREGNLLKQNIKDSSEKFDTDLIKLLLSDKDTKDHFFDEIDNATIFNYRKFIDYIDDKNFLIDSYTKFSNKVGLTLSNKHLQQINDVVLSFPFKDCVLKGGQSKDDEKRDEIFFNEVLAKDEINRLLDEKVITNAKKYTKDGVSDEIKFNRDKNGLIKDNLIIKGNNLLALHTLKSNFAGKVKLIYIDPPYNKGGNADTFCYNNNFKRSTWLTFMKNRLEVAKKLLRDDGAIIVAIDSKEQYYLGILLDEIFKEYENHCITVVHNPGGVQGNGFSTVHEYAFFVFPKGQKIVGNRKIDKENIKYVKLRNWGGESERKDAKNCFYPIIVKNNQIIGFGDIISNDIHPKKIEVIDDKTYIYPIDKEGVERKWRYARQSIENIKHLLKFQNNDIQLGKDFGSYKTVWQDKKYDASTYGTKLVKKLVPNCKFDFPKSLWTVYDCIYAVVGNDKNAIVLDYHAGSGTTAHAVLELNKNDCGNRQFILVEQMDYINDVTCQRVKRVLEKDNIDSEFIYFELDKYNQKYIDELSNATDKTILKLYDEILEKAFLNYDVESKKLLENKKDFATLSLNEQQEFLISILNKNQLYKNLSEMDDKELLVDEKTKALNADFYNE